MGESAVGSPYEQRFGFTRREFLRMASALTGGVTLAGAGGLALAGCEPLEQLLAQIANRPMRRDITTMQTDDPVVQTYREAVTAMQALDASNPRSWTAQSNLHRDYCPHSNWLFLPWHRAYIYFFEEICRELTGDDDFALPYWDWIEHPQIPSVFWQDDDGDNPLFHANRTAGPADAAQDFHVGQTNIDQILAEGSFLNFGSEPISAGTPQTTFDAAGFGPLEGGPHNHVHVFVGGTMLDPNIAARDPIFWTHHSMVESVWVEWNMYGGNPNTNDPEWTQRTFTEFVDRNGDPVEVSVLETTLYPLLLYRYERLVS